MTSLPLAQRVICQHNITHLASALGACTFIQNAVKPLNHLGQGEMTLTGIRIVAPLRLLLTDTDADRALRSRSPSSSLIFAFSCVMVEFSSAVDLRRRRIVAFSSLSAGGES